MKDLEKTFKDNPEKYEGKKPGLVAHLSNLVDLHARFADRVSKSLAARPGER